MRIGLLGAPEAGKSYAELFMVAGHRLAEEEKVGNDRITVGTMADTLVYAAVHGDVTMQQNQEARRNAYLGAQAAMQGLALIFRETWDYDMAFYLPYSEEQRVKKNGTWEGAVDAAYPAVLESFEVPFTYAVTGDLKERISIVKETITLVQDHKAETTSPE
jgi:hypothetical protein